MIFLVEDSANLARCLVLLLAPAKVTVAADMRAAIALIEHAGAGDTVIIDLTLPDSSALNTIARIAEWKAKKNPPRVIIITANNDDRVIAEAKRSSADALALKHDPTGFFEKLRDLGLIAGLNPKSATLPIVDEIERQVREITDG